MWKNNVERGRPQTTIWRMRIACWIPKATNTRTGCAKFTAFPLLTVVVRTRLIVPSYVQYIACLVMSLIPRTGLLNWLLFISSP